MLQGLKVFSECERGAIAILYAVFMVPVTVAAGLAFDFSRAYSARSALQSAVDAAAISGANSADQKAIAEATFAANIEDSGFAAGARVQVDLAADSVSVIANYSVPTTLAKIVGYKSLDLSVTSTARRPKSFGNASRPCVVALSPSAEGAFYVNGTTNFEAVNCGVYSNSAHAESIRALGAPIVTGAGFCTVGSFDISSNFLPMPQTGCSPIPDPLSELPAPPHETCDGNEKVMTLKKGNHTLEPGTFCGGLKIQSQANVEFTSGVYIIRNGALTFQSGSLSGGANVTFYLSGANALIDVNGGSDVQLSAPMSGPYAGLVAIQDRTSNPGATSRIQGGGTVKITGGLYLPTQIVEIGGNGDLGQDGNAWTIIADQVHLKGNGRVRIEASFEDSGLPVPIPAPSSVGPSLMR